MAATILDYENRGRKEKSQFRRKEDSSTTFNLSRNKKVKFLDTVSREKREKITELVPEGPKSTKYRPKHTGIDREPSNHFIRETIPHIDDRLPYGPGSVSARADLSKSVPDCAKYLEMAESLDKKLEVFVRN